MAHHGRQIAAATTAAARLWKACAWLVAEARHAGQLGEVTNAVLELVGRVQKRLPLPDAPHEMTAAITDQTNPRTPRVPWYARGGSPSTTDRREVA